MQPDLPHSQSHRRATLLGVIAVLAGANVVGNLVAPSWSYIPLNLVLGGLVLWVAVGQGGATLDDLGLRPGTLRRGLLVGVFAAAAAGAVIAVAAALPATRPLFEDERAADAAASGFLYQVLVRIPLGTALYEEVAFRGVVYGLGRRLWGGTRAAVFSSALFGLWHVLPSLNAASANQAAERVSAWAIVAGAVVFTTLAGLAFAWLRERARSTIAPVVVHAAINAAAFVAAWLVVRGGT